MNILTNAVNSLLNQASRQEIAAELPLGQTNPLEQVAEPQITITTQVRSAPNDGKVANPASRWISIQITDNGPGLSEEKYRQILESLSVEKRADKETSLAVSYQIITAKHGGKFYLRPRPSVSAELAESANSATCSISSGMEFEIWLPLV
jgi:signal transduction histidine kinase